MVDFISEVQEELRKDDYNRWLKRYGPYALAGIVLVIAGAGFMEWNAAQKDKKARITSQSFIAASELASEGKTDAAINDFLTIAETSPSGYAGLSKMRAAELELGNGDTAKAVALLDEAALIFEKPRHQQLAQIKAAYILAGEGQYSDVASRTAPLAEKEQPYEFLARELLGFASKEQGDVKTARQQFSYLKTIPGVPESIQQRATQYLDLMSVAQANETPVETAPEDNTPVDDAAPASTQDPTESQDAP